MKRRYQRSADGEKEESGALIQHKAGGRRERERETERGGGSKRKIAFRLCSVKGEITHLRRFFQATTGTIDHTHGFMSQFSTWNIDTENPFYPCLLAFSHSFPLSLSIRPPPVCGMVYFWNRRELIKDTRHKFSPMIVEKNTVWRDRGFSRDFTVIKKVFSVNNFFFGQN